MKLGNTFRLLRRRTACILALALLVPATGACGLAGERFPSYRYRLTVEVDTPDGVKRGSSVIGVDLRRSSPDSLPMGRVLQWRIQGEAVVVDLGTRGTMFALLESSNSKGWVFWNMFSLLPPRSGKSNSSKDGQAQQIERMLAITGRHQLPRWDVAGGQRADNYPLLVRFADPDDPKSVQRIDPENMAASYGPGVRLRSITVERTTDPPGPNIILQRLKWLKNHRGSLDFVGRFRPENPEKDVTEAAFKRDF
jgi:hypothetical protein